ncbi:MAG TPA: glycyl-radical enzyme activating protein, partial [Bacteroidales bacterium]|nr:glycyl-radical enzyme activating protein [Bacteroidales bacterium]
FSVKRYSIHDGPGIRVTFFMKGCPLSCWWCHNPEGISPDPETVREIHKIGVKEFIKSEDAGRFYSIDEILHILEKERIFITESKGGVTFSGGEPLYQPEFLLDALKVCKSNGYHTTVDTSGYASPENYLGIIPYTDLFLYDIKHLDDLKHFECTGVSNAQILSNFRLILESSTDIYVRIPVIPGYNDDNDHLEILRNFLIENKSDNLKKINLLPFHKTGQAKYRKFGIAYKMNGIQPPLKERMNELKEYFSGTGIKVKIGG